MFQHRFVDVFCYVFSSGQFIRYNIYAGTPKSLRSQRRVFRLFSSDFRDMIRIFIVFSVFVHDIRFFIDIESRLSLCMWCLKRYDRYNNPFVLQS